MSRPKPVTVHIDFDDGSTCSASFESLPGQLQFEILRQPFAGKPSASPEKERFVLLEWDDGWREVIEVDAKCTDINRYYVISRPEDVGRLSLNKEDDYPELIEIIRKPLDLKRIAFTDTFHLDPDKSTREGKKIDHFFALSKKGDILSEIMADFKKAVAEENTDIQELRREGSDQLPEKFEKIRRRMGLKAGQRQQDVYDFIAYLAKTAA